MKPTNQPAHGTNRAPASATTADLLIDRACRMLTPLVRLLIANGVGYTALAKALKAVFIDAARTELSEENHKLTDAAISLRSGVHRKEVRNDSDMRRERAQSEPADDEPARAMSMAEQVFTRWSTDAGYRNVAGEPAELPIAGTAPSFESLAQAVTRDFSKRAILDELIRLGLVRLDGDTVTPLALAVIPTTGFSDISKLMAANVQDHLAAGSANLRAVSKHEKPPFLEHSMYANGLSDESIAQLKRTTHDLWRQAFERSVDVARQRYDIDKEKSHQGRMRFGVYFYSEADDAQVSDDANAGGHSSRQSSADKNGDTT